MNFIEFALKIFLAVQLVSLQDKIVECAIG